ncbi:MAG: PspC domain-containing protein [Bacteroidota bacterium]|nr:PspC domain-containing protein [Bacteroidota bacterium]
MNNQRLYRSQTNKVFAGVCGGLAEYFDVDPVVIRVLFVLMVLFGGTGIVLYIAAIFIVPKKPFIFGEPTAATAAGSTPLTSSNANVRNWFGIVLVSIGVILLLANLDIFHFFNFVEGAFEFIFPVLLIISGMAVIYYRQTQTENFNKEVKNGFSSADSASTDPSFQSRSYREFRRSLFDKKLFGVCGGLAQYFGIDSSLIRMLYVVLCLASFGAGFVLYAIIALVVPYENVVNARVQ